MARRWQRHPETLMFTVIGEALIDLVEDPDGRFTAHPGGSPLNVAVGLARLGHRTHFRTRFSDSAFGRRLRAHALANDVDIRHAPDATEPAGLAVVTVDPAGGAAYNFYVDGAADWQWQPGDLTDFPPGTRAVHTGSLAAFLDPGAVAVEAALSAARSAGHLVSLDPNIRPRLLGSRDHTVVRLERLLAYPQIVKVSDADLDWLYPGVAPADIASRGRSAGGSRLGWPGR
jgi:fructokinase